MSIFTPFAFVKTPLPPVPPVQYMSATGGTVTTVGSVALGANATTPGGWLNVGTDDVFIAYTLAGAGLTTGAATIIVTYAVRDSSGNQAQPASQQ